MTAGLLALAALLTAAGSIRWNLLFFPNEEMLRVLHKINEAGALHSPIYCRIQAIRESLNEPEAIAEKLRAFRADARALRDPDAFVRGWLESSGPGDAAFVRPRDLSQELFICGEPSLRNMIRNPELVIDRYKTASKVFFGVRELLDTAGQFQSETSVSLKSFRDFNHRKFHVLRIRSDIAGLADYILERFEEELLFSLIDTAADSGDDEDDPEAADSPDDAEQSHGPAAMTSSLKRTIVNEKNRPRIVERVDIPDVGDTMTKYLVQELLKISLQEFTITKKSFVIENKEEAEAKRKQAQKEEEEAKKSASDATKSEGAVLNKDDEAKKREEAKKKEQEAKKEPQFIMYLFTEDRQTAGKIEKLYNVFFMENSYLKSEFFHLETNCFKAFSFISAVVPPEISELSNSRCEYAHGQQVIYFKWIEGYYFFSATFELRLDFTGLDGGPNNLVRSYEVLVTNGGKKYKAFYENLSMGRKVRLMQFVRTQAKNASENFNVELSTCTSTPLPGGEVGFRLQCSGAGDSAPYPQGHYRAFASALDLNS